MPQVFTGQDSAAQGFDGESLALGEEIMPRSLGIGGSAVAVTGTSQLLLFSYFTARKGLLTGNVRVMTGTTAAGATPSLCRIGLYTVGLVNAVLTNTLVASVASDTTLFAGASTAYSKAWTTAYQMQPGQRYALAILVVTAAAAPTFAGQLFTNTAEANINPRLTAQYAAQADLPASVADSALANAAGRFYGVVLT